MSSTSLNSSTMNPRYRRKRRGQTKLPLDPQFDDKENQFQVSANIISKPTCAIDSFSAEQTAINDPSVESLLRSQLRQCLQRTSVASDLLDMLDYISRASLSGSLPAGALRMSSEGSGPNLIRASRKLVKEATNLQQREQRDDETFHSCLFVAFHTLRSVGPLFDDDSNHMNHLETELRLLYHLVHLTAGAEKNGNSDWRLQLISIAAFDTFQKRLRRYACPSGRLQDATVLFHRVERFTVPILDSQKRSGIGTMSLRQVSSIALKIAQATATASNLLWKQQSFHSQSWSSLSKTLLPYGELCLAIVQQQRQNSANPFSPILEVFQKFSLPWMEFLANSRDSEYLKDLPSYSKVAHRTLWDIASILKTAKNHKHADLDLWCLELRLQAILMLIPHTKDRVLDIDCNLQCACSYAWKAATVFAQSQSITAFPVQQGVLVKFHQRIGAAIDVVMSRAEEMPLSFVEYATYRMLHTGGFPSSSCYFANTSSLHQALLAVTLLGVRLRHCLEGSCSCQDNYLDSCEDTMLAFNRQVVPRIPESELRESVRYFKLLSTISLHRSVFSAVKQQDWLKQESHLRVAGVWLTTCLGPLVFALLDKDHCEDGLDISQAYDMAVESYIRPLSLFEKMSAHYFRQEGETSSTYSAISHKSMQDLYGALTTTKIEPPRLCLEKCAKSLSIISRQQAETSREQQSICSQLISLQMYKMLVERQSINGNANEYQLSARLSQLATTYQTLGRKRSACLVLFNILALESSNHDTQVDLSGTQGVDLIYFMADRSKGVLSPRRENMDEIPIVKATIRRIMAVYYDSGFECLRKDNPTVKRSLTLSSTLDMLMQRDATTGCISSLLKDDFGTDMNCVSLVMATFLSNLNTMTYKKLTMLVDVIVYLGEGISRFLVASTSRERLDCILSGYESVVSIAAKAVSVLGSHSMSSLFVSLLHLVAATSLLPVRSFYGDTIQGTNLRSLKDLQVGAFKKFTRQSKEYVDSVSVSELPEIFLSLAQAFRLSVHQFSLYVDGIQPTDDSSNVKMTDFIELCKDTIDRHVEMQPRGSMATRWIKWTLMNLQSRLLYKGDMSKSATIALWTLLLVDPDDIGERCWFYSIAILAYLGSQSGSGEALLEDVDLFVSKDTLSRPMSFKTIAEYTLLLSVSSLQTYRCGRDEGIDLTCVKKEIEELSSNVEGDVLVLSKWLLSSIEISQARSSLRSGFFPAALEHIQACSALCQSIMAQPRISAGATPETPLWVYLARATLFIQSNQRYADCILLKSHVYIRLGDHRKASTYIMALPGVFGIEVPPLNTKDRRLMLRGAILSYLSAESSVIRNIARWRLEIESMASPSDLVIKEFSAISPQELTSNWTNEGFDLTMIQDLITAGNILYGEAIASRISTSFMEYYREASRCQICFRLNSTRSDSFPRYIENKCIETKLLLIRARCILEASKDLDEISITEVRSLCEEVINYRSSSSIDKAWAFFYSGTLDLDDARQSGMLRRLWTESSVQDTSLQHEGSALKRARHKFSEAATLIDGSINDVFYRTVLRSLALVAGPEMDELSSESAGVLVLSSIGRSARRLMARTLLNKAGTGELHGTFMCFDHNFDDKPGRDQCLRLFFSRFAKIVPSSWCFMATTICLSGELLITSLEKSKKSDTFSVKTRCIFPDDSEDGAYDNILKPLDDILTRTEQQLNGMDPSTIGAHYGKDDAKKSWWNIRNRLDQELCAHIERVETRFFSTIHLRSNSSDPIFEVDDPASLPCGNLASRFEAACDLSEDRRFHYEGVEDLQNLTVPKLKDKLRGFGFSNAEMRKLRKNELIEKLIESIGNQHQSETAVSDTERNQSCLFLLLDENLHRFPFEGMASLQGKSVCRIPSLPFVYSALLDCVATRKQWPIVDPSGASFVLDPENNLQATQERLLPVLQKISSSNGWNWNGAIGKPPSHTFFHEALKKDDGLLIYIGHGGAQSCFSRRQVDRMILDEDNSEVRTCKASVILMGCSSGKLLSVNRKHSESVEQLPLYFEPEGIALSYLCAGSPCVVGNMWDVTDHDIDRFSISLFRKFLGGSDLDETQDLARCVASARSACKLKYIVGCAPVCYGVPVHLF